MMSKFGNDFDPIGVVVDWIDACRERSVSAIIALYDDNATVDCCEGGRFQGRSQVEQYWRSKLMSPAAKAIAIDALMPVADDGVSLDYHGYDGQPVRTHFRFNAAGKIIHTACGQVGHDSSRPKTSFAA
jgi:hypothetical protein